MGEGEAWEEGGGRSLPLPLFLRLATQLEDDEQVEAEQGREGDEDGAQVSNPEHPHLARIPNL